LCAEKKIKLNIIDEDFAEGKRGRQKKTIQQLKGKLDAYRAWLLQLTICDPACGSGAFLNQVLEYLMAEHRYLDELESQLFGTPMVLPNVENQILENNIFGVDINEESVEIARLSLWLRTAKKGRKLSSLNSNIKVGNSLIDDPVVAGNLAFNWGKEFPQVFAKGGFDVVVGNPPYGAKLDNQKIYQDKYGFSCKSDTYQYFTILAHEILKQKSYCGFIIPNSWMTRKAGTEFRSKLFMFDFRIVIDFINQVFDDANIDTCIIIYSKLNNMSDRSIVLASKIVDPVSIINVINYENIDIDDWIDVDKFNCDLNKETFQLFKKIKNGSTNLGDLGKITGGYKPYQVGYGKSVYGDFSQIDKDIENRSYHSQLKKDDSYYPDIKGLNIKRYFISRNTQWVKWGEWLMSPKNLEDFTNPKIIVREVAGETLNSSLDFEGYFTNDTTHMIREMSIENLKYCLSIINSKLIGWFFSRYFGESNDLFPKIKVNELKEIPIKNSSSIYKAEVGIMVDQILNASKILLVNIDIVLNLIQAKFSISKPSTKLQNWPSLDFKGFLGELKKAKVQLSLSEEADWITYFNEQKQKANALQSEINRIDAEIDKLVYELYGLTEEEIRIVEGGEVSLTIN